MKFADLLSKVSDLPCFTAGFLAAGENLAQVRLQINRWVNDGRVLKLRKGLYTLAEPYRRVPPQPFSIANNLKRASYVSLQSALSWYGIIPEFVPVTTSITAERPQAIETPLGRFDFRHVMKKYFWGYRQAEIGPRQTAFVACPEKALLDLVYLTAGGGNKEYIVELRLQNFEMIDKAVLRQFAARFRSPKISHAVANILEVFGEGEGVEL